ncbi:MAG: nitroreductase family protein, partial [Synergistaceae bacterium]|nr:nitroreductase family protein [Synergistaceae bacterium]
PDQFITSGFHDCLIVTCDRVLMSPAELNDQEYINGGIFLGYLVLSIHAHGLGSCLCQFLQKDRRQEKVKRSFGISDSEVIVCFVGIGELEDEVNCACSQRRSVDTVAISLDS